MAGDRSVAMNRLMLGLVGGLAGLSFYLVFDLLPDRLVDQDRLILFLGALAGAFFTACMAMAGPVRLRAAIVWSAGLSVISAGLITWASVRFDEVSDFLRTGHPLAAYAIVALIPLPYIISRNVDGRWDSYPALFSHSWDIVVRYAAAWVFVGVVWAVVMLSDALLRLVGLTIIKDLLDIDPVPYVLTGFTLGVALAVVNELSEYVSPFLVLRLLRLLLPVVLMVVVIFLGALPFRGLSNLFGSFSAAATLMSMAIGATTLVTTAIDSDDAAAVRSPFMLGATRLLALTLPTLGVLAAVAIWDRVDQYGLSPDRLAAATLDALVLTYGAFYAVWVLLGKNWRARIRRTNTILALVVLAVAALWLTPVFDPQRISAANQIARLKSGKTSADKIDLWTIGREWGVAGQTSLETLASMGDPVLEQRLADLAVAGSRAVFEGGSAAARQRDRIASLRATMPVRPKGSEVPEAFFDSLPPWRVDEYTAACSRTTPRGNPGCLVLALPLSDWTVGPEIVVAILQSNRSLDIAGYAAAASGKQYERHTPLYLEGTEFRDGGAILDTLYDGGFDLVPVTTQSLAVGGSIIFFGP